MSLKEDLEAARRQSKANTEDLLQNRTNQAMALEYVSLPLDALEPNPNNPRKDFRGVDELAESIKTHGVMQPIRVRQLSKERFQIISGERRWRASKEAGKTHISCLLVDKHEKIAIAEEALIENLVREDLNFIEIVDGLATLQQSGMTQEQIAARIHKSRSVVANLLRAAPLFTLLVREAVGRTEYSDVTTLFNLGPKRLDEEATLLLIESHELLPMGFRRGELTKAEGPDEVKAAIKNFLANKPEARVSVSKGASKSYDRKTMGRLNFAGGGAKVSFQPDSKVSLELDITGRQSIKDRKEHTKMAIQWLEDYLRNIEHPQRWWEKMAELRNRERAKASADKQRGKAKPRSK